MFNAFGYRHDDTSQRINSIQRKLYNAMFLIESADSYTPSRTGEAVDNVKEMRAMDAYTDASMAELHGALDMLASALSSAKRLSNGRGRPFSFAQMFDNKSGSLDSMVANTLGKQAERVLDELMTLATDLIDENNGSKHRAMSDVFLIPSDYPDYLIELSQGVMPEMTTGKNVREWIAELRDRTNKIGEKICEVVPLIFS